jgi:hypothetical protein
MIVQQWYCDECANNDNAIQPSASPKGWLTVVTMVPSGYMFKHLCAKCAAKVERAKQGVTHV